MRLSRSIPSLVVLAVVCASAHGIPEPPNGSPVADAGPDQTIDVTVTTLVAFNGSGSYHQDPMFSLVAYDWDLDGDGQYDDAQGVTTTHDYAGFSAGSQLDVGLQVTDSYGLTDADFMTLTFVPEPATLALLALGGLTLIPRRR